MTNGVVQEANTWLRFAAVLSSVQIVAPVLLTEQRPLLNGTPDAPALGPKSLQKGPTGHAEDGMPPSGINVQQWDQDEGALMEARMRNDQLRHGRYRTRETA
jgi:hypothetical protein